MCFEEDVGLGAWGSLSLPLLFYVFSLLCVCVGGSGCYVVCVVCVCEGMRSHVPVCKGQQLASGIPLIALFLIVWNEVSHSLALADSAKQLAVEPSLSFCLYLPRTGWTTAPSFLCGGWGSQLGSLSVCGHHFKWSPPLPLSSFPLGHGYE